MPTRPIAGGVTFPSGVGTRGRVPKIADSGAVTDFEDSVIYAPPDIVIPNASVGALRATPYEIFPAPGTGKVVQLIAGVLMHDYTAPAWTESTANLEIRYTGASGAIVSLIEMTGFITLTADAYIQVVPLKDVLLVANAKLVLFNNGAAEFGNSGGGTLVWKAIYNVFSV